MQYLSFGAERKRSITVFSHYYHHRSIIHLLCYNVRKNEAVAAIVAKTVADVGSCRNQQ